MPRLRIAVGKRRLVAQTTAAMRSQDHAGSDNLYAVTGDERERADRARSVYALHIIHPDTTKRHTQQLKNLLADLLISGWIMGANTGPGNVFVKVTLEIVDVRTGRTVLTMDERVENAPGVVDLISADLDRLDARTFADEWGLAADA
jgi:hypothetical protein